MRRVRATEKFIVEKKFVEDRELSELENQESKISESSEEEREEEQSTVLPTPLRRSHQEEQKEAEERFAAEHGDEDDEDEEDDEDDEDDEDGSEEDEGADQGDRVKTEPGFERETDAARYRGELEERYAAEVARARWMSSGDQSYGGPAYGWNPTAWPGPTREPPRPFGWTTSPGWSTAPAANAPATVVSKKEKTKKPTAVATTATPTKPSTVPAPPKKKKSAKNGGVPANKGGMTTGVNAWNASPFPAQSSATVPDMYRPVDEDEDFDEAAPAKSAAASETPAILKPMVDHVKALAQEVRSFVKGEQEWRNKVELSGETAKAGADEDERRGVKKKKKNVLPENEMDAKDAEAVVYSNIGVPASDGSVEASAVRDREEGEESPVENSPRMIRALGRRSVHEWLKKVRDEGDRPESEGTPLGPSHRDQVPEVDWVQLLTVTAELTKRDSVPLPDWVTFSEWVERYHSKCGELVWKKLLEHEADKTIPKEEKEPRTKELVDFDSSSLKA
ncbi:hypothetical protein PF004_g5818 [Phytophthora fragariae]|uniref:Uncharacterized protein n=1 Tax=Phytophthora fragariae TaxID=53985 RepID=A0A6G0PEV3_9STRA|nr:hypothetical protein PF004_g5818 [Phytophthora fragariae]